jgi:RNA polymerase sigma-70 factor (ECF subfamily)
MKSDKNFSSGDELLPHLFRTEYSKMTAALCRLFGIRNIDLAEDIASETFLKATEVWSLNGLPENPVAWLYVVAKNKTKDYFKTNKFVDADFKRQPENLSSEVDWSEFEVSERIIEDSQLEMIFRVCSPVNSAESQICLVLQTLCGFSIDEIANAFLTNRETIKKRLYRAKENLRSQSEGIYNLDASEISGRLDNVLTSIYLLFNEGYFSTSTNDLIRKELCVEAMRLAYFLTENPITNTPKANALLALLCFQSSRFDARQKSGEAILFDEQNRDDWEQELIERGNHYLTIACSSSEISKYHLEASIAYCHISTADTKWDNILQLYNQLLMVEYSPVAALNRTFALSKVFGNAQAITEAEKLKLTSNRYYHSLLGYLYSPINKSKAIEHFQLAIDLSKSKVEKAQLQKHLTKLKR